MEPTLGEKIVQIVMYDQTRVNGGSKYDTIKYNYYIIFVQVSGGAAVHASVRSYAIRWI